MATVTGYTAERMQEIEDTTVVDGEIDGSGHLILEQRNGTLLDAGSVIGPTGPTGATGPGTIQIVTNATIPSSPSLGHQIYNSDTGTESFWNGSAWVQKVPAGILVPSALSTAPLGWLLCNGSPVSRTTYAGLFAAIGSTYGAGDGSTTFNVPNLKGRMPVGFDSADASFDTLGEAGGAKTHTLTVPEMPAHNHSAQVSNSLSAGGFDTFSGSGAGTTGVAGGGAPHNNMPPYMTVNYIVKT